MHGPLIVKVHYIDINLIVHHVLISFHCINLMFYLCIVFIKLLFIFYCHDSLFAIPVVILMTCCVSTVLDRWNTE
jgi:L-cystine uptake protein TcyP (sodium:dicarboxylate symporter family)